MTHPFEFLTIPDNADMRGIPTQTCACGSEQFYIVAHFSQDTYALAGYLTDGVCAHCGALVTVCTEIDHPNYEGKAT